MKILIITVAYPPEIRSASHLMYELACELRDRGEEVTVLTTSPQYNLADKKASFSEKEVLIEEGIRVLRIKTLPVHKIGFFLRGIGILTLPLYFLKVANKHIKEIDMVLVYSPPLPLALLGAWLKKSLKCKFILNLHDLFPQNAIDLGILKNPIPIAFFEFIEKLAYKYADHITVHSEGNLRMVTSQGKIPENKVSVLNNWVDVEPFESVNDSGKYREKYSLHGKFIILFAGVIGPAQGLDFIIPLAEDIIDTPKIVFLVVGDGTEKAGIEKEAKKKNLQNIYFKEFISKEEYPFLVKDMDAGLVTLSKDMKTPVVPGKLQGYMAAAIPVIGILNKESDGHSLIRESGAGFSVEAGNIEASVQAIRKLYTDKDLRKRMGRAGHDYVLSHFTKPKCVDSLCHIFNKILKKE